MTLEHFKAEHGPTKIAATGQFEFRSGGGWHLRLDGLSVDRLQVDPDFKQAVPSRLRKALDELKPTGTFSLRGGLEMARTSPDDPVRSQWDVALGMQQAGIDCGIRLENIFGSLSLAGGFDGHNFHSGGELALDSLTCKDCQFTQVMGPVWIDDQQVFLGSLADRRQSEMRALADAQPRQFRSLTAGIYGGTLYGDAWVTLGPQPRYGIRAEPDRRSTLRAGRKKRSSAGKPCVAAYWRASICKAPAARATRSKDAAPSNSATPTFTSCRP